MRDDPIKKDMFRFQSLGYPFKERCVVLDAFDKTWQYKALGKMIDDFVKKNVLGFSFILVCQTGKWWAVKVTAISFLCSAEKTTICAKTV